MPTVRIAPFSRSAKWNYFLGSIIQKILLCISSFWVSEYKTYRAWEPWTHRREPLDEAPDSTFGILENYHC